jgi:hypothetical protein
MVRRAEGAVSLAKLGQAFARFTADTAAETGNPERTIRRDATRAALGLDLDRVAGTSLDKGRRTWPRCLADEYDAAQETDGSPFSAAVGGDLDEVDRRVAVPDLKPPPVPRLEAILDVARQTDGPSPGGSIVRMVFALSVGVRPLAIDMEKIPRHFRQTTKRPICSP